MSTRRRTVTLPGPRTRDPRAHGPCPECQHYGTDCGCHRRKIGRLLYAPPWHEIGIGVFAQLQGRNPDTPTEALGLLNAVYAVFAAHQCPVRGGGR